MSSTMPENPQMSEDGNYWWDGSEWQPVAGQSQSPEAVESSDTTTNQINSDEFPSIARVLYFGEDVDGYLQDLGIDITGLDNDDPPESPAVA